MPRRRVLTTALLGTVVAVALATTAAALSPDPSPPTADTFGEEISVAEASVVVALPARGSRWGVDSGQLLVREAGRLAPVTRVEPLDDGPGGGWRLVVYLDGVLTSPERLREIALALAERAESLVESGPVDLVLADPAPERLLVAVREPRRLSAVLGEVAREGPTGIRLVDDQDRVRRQIDRLLVEVGEPCPTRACAVLIASDELEASADLVSVGRALGASGWVAIGIPLHPGYAYAAPPLTAYEEWRSDLGSPPGLTRRPLLGRRPPSFDPRSLDVFLRPGRNGLVALAEATSGTVVTFGDQLEHVLEGLESRWRVWYRSDLPRDGDLHRVEVVRVSDGTVLRGSGWAPTATPPRVVEARLVRHLAERRPEGELRARATWSGEGEQVLWLSVGEVAPTDPVRVSLAFRDRAGTTTLRHALLPPDAVEGSDGGRRWQVAVPVGAPEGTVRLAWALEPLGSGRWGVGGVDLSGS